MRPLNIIAEDILRHKISAYALPYVKAMLSLSDCSQTYYADSGHSIVLYALNNLRSMRGAWALALKNELREHVGLPPRKGKRHLAPDTL